MFSKIMNAAGMVVLLYLAGCSTAGNVEEMPGEEREAPETTQVDARFIEGEHYTVLQEPIPASVEVTEFFYFGCLACYQLMPALSQWSVETGNQVELIPAHTDTNLVEGAMLFHTFVEMGILAQMYEWGYVMYMTEDARFFAEEDE